MRRAAMEVETVQVRFIEHNGGAPQMISPSLNTTFAVSRSYGWLEASGALVSRF
jgi:hypothetical protein